MAIETLEATTIEDARAMAAGRGRCLVMAPDTLRQIEEAEAAGGFEGGMTGNAGGAPFSGEGRAGDRSSSASDQPELLDLEGSVAFSMETLAEGLIEIGLSLRDLLEAVRGVPLGPIILVPSKELKRLLTGAGGERNEA